MGRAKTTAATTGRAIGPCEVKRAVRGPYVRTIRTFYGGTVVRWSGIQLFLLAQMFLLLVGRVGRGLHRQTVSRWARSGIQQKSDWGWTPPFLVGGNGVSGIRFGGRLFLDSAGLSDSLITPFPQRRDAARPTARRDTNQIVRCQGVAETGRWRTRTRSRSGNTIKNNNRSNRSQRNQNVK